MSRTPDALKLEKIYRARFSGKTDYRDRVWKVLAPFFSQWFPQNGSILDLGAGYCEFINNAQAGTKYAMDLNPDVGNRAASGITVLQQDCSLAWPIPEDHLDAVFTSNFLEHLPDKSTINSVLSNVYRHLKPGGRIISLGPNIKFLPGAYWDFYDHFVELTELSLAEALSNCNFEIEKCLDRFVPYTMSQGRQYPVWVLKLYLSSPWIWPFFGKQFLVVARKTLNQVDFGVPGVGIIPSRHFNA